MHHDEGTGVTLVQVEAPPVDRDAVADLMHDLLAGCGAEELIGA